MSIVNPPLADGETIEREIPPSKKTVAYYSIKAAPLFGVWFILLIAFLLYTFKTKGGSPQVLLFQALALSAMAYLVGIVARWLWRVDISQRDAWLTNKGIWIQTPSGMQFVSYNELSSVRRKTDWMEKWLRLDELELVYVQQNTPKKTALVGVENADEILRTLQKKMPRGPTSA